MRTLDGLRVGVVGVLLCAAGAAGQTCNYGEPASSDCLMPRVIGGWEGHHVVLMDCHAATNTGAIGGVPVGDLVYFEVTPQISGPMTISTCHPNTTYDTVVGLYQRVELCQFEYLTHNDDAYWPECPANCTGYASNLTWNVTAGTTYTIMVGSYNSNPQNCPLCLGLIVSLGTPCGDPPRNFICAMARPLSGTPGSETLLIDANEASGFDSFGCQPYVSGPLWFAVTPQVSGTLTIDTCRPGTNYDTVVRILQGNCSGWWIELACADDLSCAYHPTAAYASAPVSAGTTYYVEVGGYYAFLGCLELMSTIEADQTGACCYQGGLACAVVDADTCTELGGTLHAGYDCTDANGNGVADVCEPEDPCVNDTQSPVAQLDWPTDFACVPLNGYAAITGTASDPEYNLWYWTLEERGMNEAGWTYITSGSLPVYNSEFWDWTPFAPGYRMLRLTALDECGHASTAVRLVYVDQGPAATLNSPGDGAVVGGTVCIDGLVSHGVCPLEWTLSYRLAGGGNWVTLATGNAPIYNLQLASWNTLGLSGSYELRLYAESPGGSAEAQVQVTVDNTAPSVHLAAPTNCAGVDGTIPVYGTVADDNLAIWSLQWSGGPSHSWNVIASGAAPTTGLLAQWDVSDLPVCAYALRLVGSDLASVNCSGYSHQTEYVVTVRVGEPGGDADLDGDGDVDITDFALFMTFFTGPL